jgi:hypothetical protein
MTSAGIYRGFCLPWVVQYLSQCYFMDLDISRRLPRTQLCPFLSASALPNALHRGNPVQHQMVLDRGAQFVRHQPQILFRLPLAGAWRDHEEAWRRDDRDKSNQA